MKLNKLLIILLLGLVLLTGCERGNKDVAVANDNGSEIDKSPSIELEDENWPRTVVDQLGREVVLEEKPMRIASSYYISTAMLVALEAEDRLVGIEMKAKTRELYKRGSNEIIDLPIVGSGKTINVEQCLSLDVDLVIIPHRLKEFIPKFEALNIPVIAVKPENLQLFLETVEVIGDATGTEERAKDFINYYEGKVNEVTNLVNDVTERPDVYLSGRGSILQTPTKEMYQSDMIRLSGGKSVSDELLKGYWSNVSVETLIKWNPEKIMIVHYADYGKNELIKDERLKDIEAIKNNEIYTFPSEIEAWDYPTPSSILGVLWLTHTLHPDKYTKNQYYEEANHFYQEYFGFQVSKQDVGLEE